MWYTKNRVHIPYLEGSILSGFCLPWTIIFLTQQDQSTPDYLGFQVLSGFRHLAVPLLEHFLLRYLYSELLYSILSWNVTSHIGLPEKKYKVSLKFEWTSDEQHLYSFGESCKYCKGYKYTNRKCVGNLNFRFNQCLVFFFAQSDNPTTRSLLSLAVSHPMCYLYCTSHIL